MTGCNLQTTDRQATLTPLPWSAVCVLPATEPALGQAIQQAIEQTLPQEHHDSAHSSEVPIALRCQLQRQIPTRRLLLAERCSRSSTDYLVRGSQVGHPISPAVRETRARN